MHIKFCVHAHYLSLLFLKFGVPEKFRGGGGAFFFNFFFFFLFFVLKKKSRYSQSYLSRKYFPLLILLLVGLLSTLTSTVSDTDVYTFLSLIVLPHTVILLVGSVSLRMA